MLQNRILDVLGAVNAANDRVKYYFSLLQLAISFAGLGERDRPDLKSERIAAGEPDGAFDAVIAGAAPASPGLYRVPQAELLATRIETAMREMLAPHAYSHACA